MYINTPLNYTGSKFKLLDQILPLFDYTKSNFVDLFTGGGVVYTNVLDRYDNIIINDIIEDIIGIHKSLYTNNNKFIEEVKSLCISKDDSNGYNDLRNSYNNEKSSSKLYALMLSCNNNMIRFNKKFNFNQTFGKRTFNDNTQKKIDDSFEHYKKYPNKVDFRSEHFMNIPIKSNTFYYVDPPYGYTKTTDNEMSRKQISEAGYNAFWNKEDDIKLYNYLKEIDSIGSTFMISGVLKHNNEVCWILDKLINDNYNYIELDYNYNKVSKNGNKDTIEIIIKNY
jgi:DNA adenine methylase Dam